MKTIPFETLASALADELRLGAFASMDASRNGVQVQNRGRDVARVCCGVDASLDFFAAAAARGADFLFVHHGLSWGSSLAYVTGTNYRLVSRLVELDLPLFAAHIPLDAHPALGNNARLAQALGLGGVEPFGTYHGQKIGFQGALPAPLPEAEFRALVARSLPDFAPLRALPFGKPEIRTVGIVSGGAGDIVEEAAREGLDAYLTGEITLASYNAARHAGVNTYFGGHYATETFGPKAVAGWIRETFGVETEFIDLELPY